MLDRLRVRAGLVRTIRPHMMRSTAGVRLYAATHDVFAVSALLGHADLNTTRIYLAWHDLNTLRASIPELPHG